MTVYISEHAGIANYRQPINQGAVASYSINSSVTGTGGPFPQSGSRYVRVSADVGSFFNNSTTSTGLALTSTNSFRISANATPELFSISTSNRIQCAST